MKKLLIICLISLVVLGCFGCSRPTAEEQGAPSKEAAEPKGKDDPLEIVKRLEKEGVPRELAAVVDHFTKNGLVVEDVHLKAYEMIGAAGGIGFTIAEGGVELYLFDPATADRELAKSLEEARKTGMFWDAAIKREIPVVMHENIMLLGLEIFNYTHPQKDRIMEVFKGL